MTSRPGRRWEALLVLAVALTSAAAVAYRVHMYARCIEHGGTWDVWARDGCRVAERCEDGGDPS